MFGLVTKRFIDLARFENAATGKGWSEYLAGFRDAGEVEIKATLHPFDADGIATAIGIPKRILFGTDEPMDESVLATFLEQQQRLLSLIRIKLRMRRYVDRLARRARTPSRPASSCPRRTSARTS